MIGLGNQKPEMLGTRAPLKFLLWDSMAIAGRARKIILPESPRWLKEFSLHVTDTYVI